MNGYITLTALGQIYGVSAQEVGRWLKGLGLRHENGQPSREALKQGFVQERPLDHGGYIEIAEGCVAILGNGRRK